MEKKKKIFKTAKKPNQTHTPEDNEGGNESWRAQNCFVFQGWEKEKWREKFHVESRGQFLVFFVPLVVRRAMLMWGDSVWKSLGFGGEGRKLRLWLYHLLSAWSENTIHFFWASSVRWWWSLLLHWFVAKMKCGDRYESRTFSMLIEHSDS